MKIIITKIGIALGVLLPSVAFAEDKNLRYLVNIVVQYLNIGVYLILSLAVIMFIYNIFKYFIAGGDNAESKKEAGLYVMWSLIGFFVILSFWGLVKILTNSLKLDSNTPPSGLFGSFGTNGSNSMGAFGDNSNNIIKSQNSNNIITPSNSNNTPSNNIATPPTDNSGSFDNGVKSTTYDSNNPPTINGAQ